MGHPHEIIPNVFLGDGQQAISEQIVSNLGITHIANISKRIKSAFADRIEYIEVHIDDLEDEDIGKHLDDVVAFIDGALCAEDSEEKANDDEHSKGARVLVHCEYGISRSSSMVIAYLMFKEKWYFETAMQFVKDR